MRQGQLVDQDFFGSAYWCVVSGEVISDGLGARGPLTTVGVDVARSGNDKTIMALRHGNRIQELRESFHQHTMATTGLLVGILAANPGARGIVDADGLGVGVFDRARERGHNVAAFHAGVKTQKTDRTKERAAVWWALREALDPAYDPVIELPPDDLLLGELTAPRWMVASNARIQIEAKDEIRKRLHRSTDRADAVVMAFWQEHKRRKARMHDTRLKPLPEPRSPYPDPVRVELEW
jgi:hypothetical protein